MIAAGTTMVDLMDGCSKGTETTSCFQAVTGYETAMSGKCGTDVTCKAEYVGALPVSYDDTMKQAGVTEDQFKKLKLIEAGKANEAFPLGTTCKVNEEKVGEKCLPKCGTGEKRVDEKCEKKDEDKKDTLQHSVYFRVGVGGAPGGLGGSELVGNPSNDEYFKEIGAESGGIPGEGSKTKLGTLYEIEGGYQFNSSTSGPGFQLLSGPKYQQIRTSNPADPGQSRTAVPADILSIGLVTVPGFAYRGTSVTFSAGPRLELLGTFLAGGDPHTQIKTGYSGESGVLGNKKFLFFDVRLGADVSIGFRVAEDIELGAYFTYTCGLTHRNQDALNPGESSKGKFNVPNNMAGGVQVTIPLWK